MLGKERFDEMTSRIRKELDDLTFNLTLKVQLIDGMFGNDGHRYKVTIYIEEDIVDELLDYANKNFNYNDMMSNLLDDNKCFDKQGDTVFFGYDREFFDGVFVYVIDRNNKLKEIKFQPCSVNMFDGYVDSCCEKYGHNPQKVNVLVEVVNHEITIYDKFCFKYEITNTVGQKKKQESTRCRSRRLRTQK